MIKVTKKNLEEIIGRNLMDWEYEVITTYIKAFRGNKKFTPYWARHQR